MTSPAGLTLDTGAVLALERRDGRVRALLRRASGVGRRASDHDLAIALPAGVGAQAWRGGPRQARMAGFFADRQVTLPALDELTARAVGALCGRSGNTDGDVQVAPHARENAHTVVSSDPGDLHAVIPALRVIVV